MFVNTGLVITRPHMTNLEPVMCVDMSTAKPGQYALYFLIQIRTTLLIWKETVLPEYNTVTINNNKRIV